MRYAEDRQRVWELNQQLGELIKGVDDEDRYRLWATSNDDLSDAVTSGDRALAGFREAFVDVAREFWLRENPITVDGEFDRKVSAPVLTIVKTGDRA